MRIRHALAALAAATIGATAAGLLTVGPAAATEPDCRTTTTTLNRPDHGHGTVNGGYWADLHIVRTTKICVAPIEVQADTVAPPAKTHYKATVSDVGTLTTIAGASLSPNDAKPLAGGVHGAVVGRFTQDFWATAGFLTYQGNFNGGTYNGIGQPATTGAWVEKVWGADDFKSEGLNEDWTWIYQTCVPKVVKSGYLEQWIDSAEKANDDGQADVAGDIVGKPCPSIGGSSAAPVPSTSTSAAPSLPVTGSTPLIVGGVGVAVAVAGVLLVLIARRRRNDVQFEA